jgi:hypothetical protein
MFDYRGQPTNPLSSFLQASAKLLDIAGTGNVPAKDYDAFTRNSEERNFCADICDRIHRIGFAYDRLSELTKEHHDTTAERNKGRNESGRYELSVEMLQADGRWDVETDVLSFYIYYELKSVADILEQWTIVPASGSELEYALKARDRFLAHPEFCRVSPRANRAKSIPVNGPTRCDIASLQQWDSITQSEYLAKLTMASPANREAEVRRNSSTILSKTRNERLTEEEVTRIKAFGAREPHLEKALEELAQMLCIQALPKIASVCTEAINKFGFEQIPEGPIFSQTLGNLMPTK